MNMSLREDMDRNQGLSTWLDEGGNRAELTSV